MALDPASREDAIDFDWLDSRAMDPVGYKRINKRTGQPGRKLFVDYLRNGHGAHWSGDRLSFQSEDPWAHYWTHQQTLSGAMKALGFKPWPSKST